MTIHKWFSPPMRIAAIYIALGALWIAGSDWFLADVSSELSMFTRISVYKGWAFIVASGFLIYYLLKRELSVTMKTQDQLRDSETLFRALFEQAAVGVAQIDSVKGQFIRINQRYCDIVGYTPKEMAQLTFQQITFPEDLEADLENMKLLLGGTIREFSIEKRYFHKDGSIIWVNLTVSPMWKIGEEPNFHIAVVEDITERKQAEQELERTRNTLSEAQKIAHLGSFEYVAATKMTVWSEEEYRIHGLDPAGPSPTYDMMLQKHIYPDDAELLHETFKKAIQDKSVYELEHRIVLPDGSVRWVYDRANPYFDMQGDLVRYVGSTLDITDRKTAELELRESEERLAFVLEGSREGFWDWNMETGTVQRNERWAEMLGYSFEDIGFTVPQWEELVHPEDKDRAWKSIMEHLEGHTSEHECEYRMLTRDGSWKWILDRARVVKRDKHGKPLRMAGTHTDIADQKKVEEALRESEQRMRAITDSTQDGIVVVRDRGEITYWNSAAERIFGHKSSEAIGKDFHTLLGPPGHRESYLEALGQFAQKGASNVTGRTLQMEAMRQNGEKFPLELSLSRFQTGDSWNVVCVIRDITERKKWEDEIIKWSSVVQHAQWGVVYSGSDLLSLESMNPSFARMHGYTVEELTGRPIFDVFAPDERSALPQHIAKTHQKGSHTWESKHLRKDGSVFPVLINATAVRDSEGKVLYRAVNVLDITEQKQSEQQLRQSEERYRTVADFNYDWEYWIDTETNLEYVSPSCERITGYSAQEFMDDPSLMGRIIHPDDLQLVLNHFNQARNVDHDRPNDLDFRIIRRDEETRWIAHACQAVYNKEGKPLGRRASNRDITDRKFAEEALRESEQRYRAVVDNLQVGISIINREMEIVAINPFFRTYYPDVQPDMGQICYCSYNDPPRSSPCTYCPCVLTFQDGKVHECETETPQGGKIRNYRIVSCPVKDEHDHVQLVIELVEDVTERRALYAQLAQVQKMEAIGTLAGGVAHDFNNILQVVLGYSEILLDDEELPQRCRSDLQRVIESARRGADLVQRLLTFSRKTEINSQPLDLNDRINELRKMLERTLPKMVSIDLHLAGKLAKINADKTQIDQILMNLAVNARDAMPEGGKLLFETANIMIDEYYAQTHLGSHPGPHVLVTVTDNGSGIDRETLEHIFEPFYTTKGVGKGTGLGLAMVHGIVKNHGGTVMCYSEPGKGTTFRIYFPALISEEHEEETMDKPMPPGGSETILLVDDDEFVLDIGSRNLRNAGYEVITASSGKEALQIYEQRSSDIDLVLLDLMMPEMGGKQCLEGLLTFNPSVKVVIASGFSANGPQKDVLCDGARAFVNKPFDMRQSLRVVREVLDNE